MEFGVCPVCGDSRMVYWTHILVNDNDRLEDSSELDHLNWYFVSQVGNEHIASLLAKAPLSDQEHIISQILLDYFQKERSETFRRDLSSESSAQWRNKELTLVNAACRTSSASRREGIYLITCTHQNDLQIIAVVLRRERSFLSVHRIS